MTTSHFTVDPTHPALQQLNRMDQYREKDPSFWKVIDATRMRTDPTYKAHVYTSLDAVMQEVRNRKTLRNIVTDAVNADLATLDPPKDDAEYKLLHNLSTGQFVNTAVALAAFRSTKYIIRMDPTMAAMLDATDIPDEIPASVLLNLPAWGMYLEMPETLRADPLISELHGAFITMVLAKGKPTLVVTAVMDDFAEGRPPNIIRQFDDKIQMSTFINPDNNRYGTDESLARKERLLRFVVATAMYMTSKEPDYQGVTRPEKPQPVKSARGLVFQEKADATVVALGYRIGAAINAARKQHYANDALGGTGRTMPAHLRKAHWHHFWTGPRVATPTATKVGGERKLILKFLPPIPVNFDDPNELLPTVRPLTASGADGPETST